jgi:hypothetical protein
MPNKAAFYVGLFVLCASTLMLQICLTRVLSVMVYFHLSFLCISMAMLGMTAGALWVYLKNIGADDYRPALVTLTRLYAASAALAPFLLATTYTPAGSLTTFFALMKISLFMAVPFFLSGAVVALCLTRARDMGSINRRYAVDLMGAACGCLVCIPVLNTTNGFAALIGAGALGLIAAGCFALAGGPAQRKGLWERTLLGLAIMVGLMGLITMVPLKFSGTKGPELNTYGSEFQQWNAFSWVSVTRNYTDKPFYWSASPQAPRAERQQRFLTIDGLAGTPYYRYSDAPDAYDFLDYDITSLAYQIRHQGHAAIIGVGGGRDVLAAKHFGFADVTVVELNPIIVDLLTRIKPYSEYAGLTNLSGITYHVDEGRSWFARTREKFDLIQLSLVDTMAATGAGAFTLSENNLYTIEGWLHFMATLKPQGVLTVSRYYSASSLDETAKLYNLALSALFRRGVTEPARHIYVAAHRDIATIMVSVDPLSQTDVAALDGWVQKRGFTTAISPLAPAATPLLAALSAARSEAELQAITDVQPLDISATTDARPFFFNQLRLRDLLKAAELMRLEGGSSVHTGNLRAMLTLASIILLSALAVVLVLLLPAAQSVRTVARPLVRHGTAYFGLIGLGFMLVEISLIQRLSVFLGYPVYGLAIALFSLILLTGLGSFIAQALHLPASRTRLIGYSVMSGIVLLALASLAPHWLVAYEGADLPVRALVAIATIAPAALLMGMAMPTGMRLTEQVDARPTPWFWAVNGATGVLASGLAVVISISWGIPTTMMVGAACYILLLVPAVGLSKLAAAR